MAVEAVLDDTDRARAVELIGADRKERIEFCHELIAAVRWRRGKTGRELSEIWGCAYNTVEQYAAEAYRRFRTEIGDPEVMRGRLIAKLDAVLASCMNRKKTFVDGGVLKAFDDPDHKAAIAAIREMAELCALHVKQHKHEVVNNYENESLEELLRRAAPLLAGKQVSVLVDTMGEESNEATDGIPHAIPNPAGPPAAERVRGRLARRNQDPRG